MQQTLLELSRAVERHTAISDLALLMHHGAAAHGARRRHLPGLGVGPALVEHGAHDLGNHVARLMDHDGVAHAHILTMHLVDIVEGRAGDSGARNGHRVKLGNRGEHTGAAHLHANLAQHGCLFFRWELKSDGPAWGAGGETQVGLLLEGIDLHDHAIDVVIKIATVCQGIGTKFVYLRRSFTGRDVGIHMEPGIAQPVQKLMLAVNV